ncbi:hypothetical protein L596_020883 [Steinernema carpocapsae]|uniref:Uncharacterized protein n=1 Tax=Steinernema carpocapsae TaxID=34508 RepID=A0A4U5MUU0_STECR|nr:hypothetical protein L596_020883 [Steinernema carpocapsae]
MDTVKEKLSDLKGMMTGKTEEDKAADKVKDEAYKCAKEAKEACNKAHKCAEKADKAKEARDAAGDKMYIAGQQLRT